ncbi:MAG: hypothetical protein WA139_04010 [Candidatus Aenigmatarchaeota archaeon]
MSGKYVNCESETKLFFCMNADCMCRNFIGEMISSHPEDKRKAGAKLTEIDCIVYAFGKEGLTRYGYGTKIRNLCEEEIRKMAII